ncbi:hypothetical protein EG327_010988 [Venturia inaequalis]|uniref:Uncharacterized protein n=1 Tax=Venturia inaequalis TaxID=5025 RepID=A0A8H3VQN6_VENIN|nr:hypothetical protein EG327_010988 [Venturia inaequalis]
MSSSTPGGASSNNSPRPVVISVISDPPAPSSISSFSAAITRCRPQQQRSTSHILADPARQLLGHHPATDTDTDFDMAVATDEHHRSGSSLGRSTIGFCACGSEIGHFYNSWSKVTGSYYLPRMVASYSCTGLHRKSKPKPASNDSALVDCERDFFKLPKIELKSDVTGQVVEAIIEGGQPDASHYQDPSVQSGRAAMDPPMENAPVNARKFSATQMPNHTLTSQHRQETTDDARRFEAMSSRPMATHASHQTQKSTFHEREPAPQNRLNERGGSFASPGNGHLHVNGHPGSPRNGYPSNIAVRLEAIDRLQTQVNLNRATLESCTRDIARVDSHLVRLQASFSEHFEGLRMEIIQSRLNSQPPPVQQGDRMDDEAFAVFSNALSNVQTKANEVDNLRLQMVDIKRRIKRLEEGPAKAPAAPTQSNDRAPYSSSARESSNHHASAAQVTMNPNVPQMTPPLRPEARPHGNMRGQMPSQTPEVGHPSYAGNAESASGGWVSVNHGAKRGFSNGVDGRSDAEDTPIGSPKRPKLTPLEPRHQYEAAPESATIRFERMDTDESQSQSQRPPSEIQNSYPDSTNPSTFIPYTSQLNPEDSWRADSQRAGAAAPVVAKVRTTSSPGRAGRPRGRGRGGRPRKSLPNDREMIPRQVTPEWEKETWTVAQVGADGFYYPGGERVRRGSGGGQGQPIQATSPQSSMGDPYGHAKKTRTKPIRNSDGVLIRKDGRPDMRSQSSAANLRKVHARKEEEKRMDPGSRTSPISARGNGVTSPDSSNSGEQERTNYALSRMFPHGVEEHRGVLTSSEHYFPSAGHSPLESNKTPATRAQSEGSAESEASTREPSHFHEQPSRQIDPERVQAESHVASSVEVDRDEVMEDRPVEAPREEPTNTRSAEQAFTEPAAVPATTDTTRSTSIIRSDPLSATSTLQPNSTEQPAAFTSLNQSNMSPQPTVVTALNESNITPHSAAVTVSNTDTLHSTSTIHSSTFHPSNEPQMTSTVHADNTVPASSASMQTHGTSTLSTPGVTTGVTA